MFELQKELTAASSYIASLEDKCYEANKASLELLAGLRDKEDECETLKQYIVDLKARIAVYIPVKGDPIDNKLAEYINNYPDRQKLKIMFMRESEGVYEFGQKKVRVSVKQNKIQIQVGGGFLSVDEFLDQYTPAELARLERRDPLRRMNERVAVQKTLDPRGAVETSPVRRQESPPKMRATAAKRTPASSAKNRQSQSLNQSKSSSYGLSFGYIQAKSVPQRELDDWLNEMHLIGAYDFSCKVKKADVIEMGKIKPRQVNDHMMLHTSAVIVALGYQEPKSW